MQNLLRLREKCGPQRLEAACERTLHVGNARYRTVAEILKKGLDQEPVTTIEHRSDSTYARGGRFLRDSKTLFH